MLERFRFYPIKNDVCRISHFLAESCVSDSFGQGGRVPRVVSNRVPNELIRCLLPADPLGRLEW